MALTLENLKEAKNALAQIQIKASNLNEILVKVEELMVALVDSEGNIIFELTTTQKNALLTAYQNRKQALVDAVKSLI